MHVRSANACAVGKEPAPVGKMSGRSAMCLGGWQCACAVGQNVWAVGNVHARSAKMPVRSAMCMHGRQKCLCGWQFRDFQQEKTFWAIFTVSMASFP